MSTRILLTCACVLLFSTAASAGADDFHAGTLIKGYGRVATVEGATALPMDTRLRVAFDLGKGASEGEVNRSLDSAARYLNMHAEAGVAPQYVSAAIVVHGGASLDLLTADKLGHANPNAELIAELIKAGASIALCGQTAAYYDIGKDDLLPGVELVLSAMTQHALLQQQGYTLNPF